MVRRARVLMACAGSPEMAGAVASGVCVSCCDGRRRVRREQQWLALEHVACACRDGLRCFGRRVQACQCVRALCKCLRQTWFLQLCEQLDLSARRFAGLLCRAQSVV